MNTTRVADFLFAAVQYILPHHLLSLMMLVISRWQNRFFLNKFIPWFIKKYKVDMSIAVNPNWQEYQSFNHFFTRSIDPKQRIITSAQNIASPVDATVSQAGQIDLNTIIQAKNHNYSVQSLIAKDSNWSKKFENGLFSTLYLSPKDYHRIHCPCDAQLIKVIHVPGRLFSVNPATARTIPNLFARNERVVCLFDSAAGPMAVILVGALFVASIETVWQDVITPPTRRIIRSWELSSQQIRFKRGEEIARFNMGSTVILLFSNNSISWHNDLLPEQKIILGQNIASLNNN